MRREITRRRFVAGTAAAATAIATVNILTRRAQAAEFTYKYANNSPLTHPMTIRMTEAINTAEDLKGFKIRVPPSPLWTSMFKAFGAAPASINFSEVYSALQTKIVEGQENPLSIIETAKLYEVQKYLATTNHMWDGFWFLANAKSWSTLPKDLQEIATRNINEAALKDRADIKALNDGLGTSLQAKRMVFN